MGGAKLFSSNLHNVIFFLFIIIFCNEEKFQFDVVSFGSFFLSEQHLIIENAFRSRVMKGSVYLFCDIIYGFKLDTKVIKWHYILSQSDHDLQKPTYVVKTDHSSRRDDLV